MDISQCSKSLADRFHQRMRRIYFAFVLLLPIFGLVSGKYVSGSISNGQKWVLVSEFSFIDDIGQLTYNVEYSVTNECCPSLAYYFHDSFESVSSNNNMDCSSKLSYAEGVFTFQNILPDNSSNTGNFSTQCSTSNVTNLRKCSGKLRLQSTHDRWWFFVLSHCNSTNGLDISYELTFTNGDSWERHLSADEMHILENQAVSLGGNILLFVVGLYFARQLLHQDKLHRAYKLFMMTLSCEVVAQLFDYIYYTHYVGNGVQLHPLQTIAELLHSTSEVIFVVLLILLANGWIITTAHLSHGTQMKLNVFLSFYILSYGILFLCKKEFFDPELSHIPFESHLDIAARTLITFAWACFLYGVILSIRRHREKKKFYVYFACFYTVWFLFQPLSALAFSVLFKEWHQLKFLRILRLSPLLCLLGFAGLLFVMRPSKVNVNFPFHARGNEVDAVEVPEPSNFQHAETFMELGNQYATLNANQENKGTLGESDDKGGFGFRF